MNSVPANAQLTNRGVLQHKEFDLVCAAEQYICAKVHWRPQAGPPLLLLRADVELLLQLAVQLFLAAASIPLLLLQAHLSQ
jgi:hypothetical protein